jgi:Zn-dependent peptidase ImmA (M78 family)/DNA-binding XRE family transcriptional regulator
VPARRDFRSLSSSLSSLQMQTSIEQIRLWYDPARAGILVQRHPSLLLMPKREAEDDLETVRALFDGRRLTQARQLAGLAKSDLADDVDLSGAAIGQFESGDARPSVATLSNLARVLDVPAAFFTANRTLYSVAGDEGHFRSVRSTSTRDRSRARAQLEILAEAVAALERRVHLPDVNLPDIDRETSPEDAARAIRLAWDLGAGPVPDVVALLESRGVIVTRLPAATEKMDAFSAWVGDRPFVLLVANKQAADRARFDAAHELAHLLLHRGSPPGDPEVERIAHRFAAEFLTPATSIRSALPGRVDWRQLAELKLTWGVSMAMLLRRMRDLGTISEPAYRRGMMDLNRLGWRTSEPVGIGTPEEPEMLGRAVEVLARERNYTIDDLAGEMSLRRANIEPFVEAWSASARAQLRA